MYVVEVGLSNVFNCPFHPIEYSKNKLSSFRVFGTKKTSYTILDIQDEIQRVTTNSSLDITLAEDTDLGFILTLLLICFVI